MDDYKYKAFISYSHTDDKWAKWLHKKLESFKIHKHLVGKPTDVGAIPAKLSPIFLDREELPSATDLGSVLTECLTNSWCQIVICSPKSAQSHWVNEEIKTFKRLGREHRIFSLIVEGEPYSTDGATPELECFPPALRFKLDAEGELSNDPAEPIAADARKGKDGKNNALIKIAAGILGVGFDELKQREVQRKQRRMVMISLATSMGMLVAIGLAITAVIARDEAELQREIANIEAETARRTTDFMVSLFSVSDPSEARGNTITAREILDKGADRIENELSTQPQIQATLMNTIGHVYTALGLYKQASPLLEKALQLRRHLFESKEAKAVELANSMEGLANVYTETANYEQARDLYLSALELPLDYNVSQLNQLKAGLAEAYFRMGKYTEAEPILRDVLTQQTNLFGETSIETAQAMQQLGLNMFDQGKYDLAEEYLNNSLAIFKKIFADESHPMLAENINNLAMLLSELGNFDKARELYSQALDMLIKLYGDHHPDVANTYMNIAMVLHSAGKLEQSEIYYRKTIVILGIVHQGHHPEILRVTNNLAFLLKDMGKDSEAETLMEQVIETAPQILGDNHSDVAKYMATYAKWLVERFEFKKAVDIHQRALDIKLAVLGDNHPSVAISQFYLAEAKLGVNEIQQALSLSNQSINILMSTVGEDHTLVALAKAVKAKVYIVLNQLENAELLLLESYGVLNHQEFVSPAYLKMVLKQLVYLYDATNNNVEHQRYKTLLSNIG